MHNYLKFKYIHSGLSTGIATRAQISRAFQIPERSISRWLSKFKTEGDGCFFSKKKPHFRIFTPEVTEKITKLHLQGSSLDEICDDVGIKRNTLSKAISQKRVVLTTLEDECINEPSTTKSSRSVSDNTCGMGKSCSNELARVLASRGAGSTETSFGSHVDLNYGGLLLAIPSLLACGLLRHISRFESVGGYYSATHVFISLSFLSLLSVCT